MESLLYIIWDEKNNTGIKIIDEQHRGIVATINTFYFFIKKGEGLKAVTPTLKVLELFTELHFNTEEDLMAGSGFPDYNNHISFHKELLNRTKVIALEANIHGDANLALKFLKEWWLNHINIEDRKYVPYIKKKLNGI
jgi:hemerythrin